MKMDPTKPRGVLKARLEQGQFDHARRFPCAALAELVEHYWWVSWNLQDMPAQQQETLPHPNVQWVFEDVATSIYGVHTRRFIKMLEGNGHAFGVKFKAGGFYPFLLAPVSTLQDRSIAASEVFGLAASRIEHDVHAAETIDAMTTIVETFLLARVPPADPLVPMVSTLVADAASDRSLTSVDALAQRGGLTKRSLQRLFKQYVGIGPKWVINRYRLHEAIAQLQEGKSISWTELALALGYFDQAHFIRDFRQLVGRTPAEYARTIG